MRLPDTEPRRNKAPDSLAARYRPIDLSAFTPEELRRYMAWLDPREVAAAPTDARAWRRVSRVLGWELLYRIEPELYERLIAGEQLHPGILDWLPRRVDRAVEVGAGTGRLTLDLASRCGHLVAVEPAEPMRRRLQAKLGPSGVVEARPGFLDALPVPTGWADLAITCSAFTLDLAHGAEAGLAELERVTRPGGLVVIVWPPDPAWLGARGYVHLSFPGEMAVEFGSPEEAVELARIFYPDSGDEVARRGERRVPYEVLRINPPRDLCWKGGV
jgi:SAM-dependent methyltransferase